MTDTPKVEKDEKTCWIMNVGNLTTHVHNPDAINPATEEVGLGFKLATGEFREIEGSVRTWRARLKDVGQLKVTADAPDLDVPVKLETVVPRPVKGAARRSNRKSREEIDAA